MLDAVVRDEIPMSLLLIRIARVWICGVQRLEQLSSFTSERPTLSQGRELRRPIAIDNTMVITIE
jgi:hypothetical protein